MTEEAAGPTVAYFAHNWDDAAIERRVLDGGTVSGFAMSRDSTSKPDWVKAELGYTQDNAYVRRVLSIVSGTLKARKHRRELIASDIILARNLDMLAVAVLTRWLTRLKTPIIYECLDIHRLLAKDNKVGQIFRKLERLLLKRTAALWVSSPGFLRNHFELYHDGHYNAEIIENRMTADGGIAPRLEPSDVKPRVGPLRVGWFGNLRCRRSLELLERLAAKFKDDIEIYLRGYPALGEIPDFQQRIDANERFIYEGKYKAPDDLPTIYGQVDLVWSGDFMDAGMNSDWLLPNRIYEGGWFGCPPIVPSSSETGRLVAAKATGFTLEEPLETTFLDLIERLILDRAPIDIARQNLLKLPEEAFIQPRGTMSQLLLRAMRG